MKPTISKSSVMKRAWNIFRGRNTDYNYCFAASLRRAWEVEKEHIKNLIEKAEELAAWAGTSTTKTTTSSEPSNWINPSPEFAAGMIEYYAQGMCGRTYFGD